VKNRFIMGALISLVCSCVYTQPRANIDENASLYERLGGLPAIESVMAGLTQNIAKDERINGFFVGVDLKRVESQLSQQVCAATGGPCTYTGDSMLKVHTGMNITEAQFNALVEDLVKSLNAHGVRQREQDELLRALGSMKKDIVNR
jgi:hemoglobin